LGKKSEFFFCFFKKKKLQSPYPLFRELGFKEIRSRSNVVTFSTTILSAGCPWYAQREGVPRITSIRKFAGASNPLDTATAGHAAGSVYIQGCDVLKNSYR